MYIKTRDGATHFVTKITLPKASDVTLHPLKKNSAVLGDSEKWSKNHWGAVAPSRPPVAAPLGLRWFDGIIEENKRKASDAISHR